MHHSESTNLTNKPRNNSVPNVGNPNRYRRYKSPDRPNRLKRHEVASLFVGEVNELESKPLPPFGRRGLVSDLAAQVDSHNDAAALKIIHMICGELNSGTGSRYVDDPTIVPLCFKTVLGRESAGPVGQLPRQDATLLPHH
jgi:hypothetical protein